MDFIFLDAAGKEPLYMQLYTCVKKQIEQGVLREGDKLPSIRELVRNLSVSKITVEKAYAQLVSEGYIENHERSRYVVNRLDSGMMSVADGESPPGCEVTPEPAEAPVCYDFTSGGMDRDGFDFSLWKRYLHKALKNKERLMSYGDSKGEEDLRLEITKYLQASRGVRAHAGQIVVGPGVQSLINMLCSMLKTSERRIAFEDPGFRNGRRIFADHGFAIAPVKLTADGIAMEELQQSEARIVYVSPSHQFPTGFVMPVGQRYRLLQWAEDTGGLIIEDDYDSEFRYWGRPIPALKGLDRGGHVVYLGSFSKVMPPSIRLSYMVLPDKLMAAFLQNRELYNQAASTVEQLALAQFMADGHLERQIRRLRKLYEDKRTLLLASLQRIFGEKVTVNESEAGLHVIITVRSGLTARELTRRALAKGCLIRSMEDYYYEYSPEGPPQMLLYFSEMPAAGIEQAIGLLKEAWFD